MTLTRISEIIHEWTGWCPNARVQNIPQRRGSEDGSAFAAAVPRGERPAGSLTGGEVLYNHSAPTFIGGLKLVVAMVCIIIAASVLVTRAGLPWLYISPVAVALAYLFVQSVYSTVNVAVSHDSLEYWFGKGVRQKKIPLADIARCSVVKNPANFGWSIRATFLEWFYNVSGPDIVEILLMDGKTIRIGTDEPEVLRQAIEAARVPGGKSTSGS
ncbi:hypothetical protein [Methanoregula sp.]|uniref:hypothetical protein n=1 Tax=Methanoregula sp. TaxID=2052170 RepID=UPI003C7909A9